MDCLFCSIARKETPVKAPIYEDEVAFAFLDIHPRAPGHTLVIPKVHAETILDLSDDMVGKLFLTFKKVTAMVNRALKPDGFTLGINHGRVSGAMVEHLHLHIIPRFKDDQGGSIHSVVDNAPKEAIEDIARRITNSR